jgi:hypothetical protein
MHKVNSSVLIGSRASFGIDIKPWRAMPRIFGCITLWVLGKPLGRDDDTVALLPLLTTLEFHISRSDDTLASDALNRSAADAWVRLRALDNRYRMSGAELFDDYEMYWVSDRRRVRLLWKAGYNDEGVLHDAVLPRDEVSHAIKEMRAVFDVYAREYRGGSEPGDGTS